LPDLSKAYRIASMEKVHVTRTKRVLSGHLWIFSNEIYEDLKRYTPGSLVEVYDMKDHFIGTGYINPHSLITIRLLTRKKETIDKEFFKGRIYQAMQYRRKILGDHPHGRIIFSEGDYLPGLIVDRYDNCLVLQFLTAGMDRFKDLIGEIIDEIFSPDVIVLRNDSPARDLEGLPLYKEIIKGTHEKLYAKLPRIVEGGIIFEVDPYEGQKTGFFIDQGENRMALTRYVSDGKGLDLFCYTGAWGLHLASRGAEVTGVDESEKALRQAEKNATINNLQDRITFIRDDVFSFLQRELERGERQYDFVILDPPAFVKSRSKLTNALKAYRTVNEMAMRLVKDGGILATSSCSYHVKKEIFLEMLRMALKRSGRRARLIELRSQARDHPVLLSMEETEYLKCAFLKIE